MIDQNNTKYEYIRFKDGKEVFAMVEKFSDSEIKLTLPMNILCKQSTENPGIVMHLGPMIPFTLENTITVNTDDITIRTSISEHYIKFYDDACTTWLDVRDNDKITIKTTEQEINTKKESIKELIQHRLQRDFDNMFDEYEEYDDEFKDYPTSEDIIH